ncbi:hypothetical protein [Peptoniphilus lacydonensis]|uniref:hypothetical protein n=1 Tax=Peptoniphilus lacydonensis TaxID=1673725 RepID=UPI00290EDE34|nr:hypothetical protein [Peptoniphilus lacydonensis]MBS6611299.1 hypothetical protein [Peptoniphilus harei]MDU5378011.1 hypothetical protein [Peptoniphilus lacydonensis]MDU5437499.1 hypothetical protein [Peptoniphilus lacydonensis]
MLYFILIVVIVLIFYLWKSKSNKKALPANKKNINETTKSSARLHKEDSKKNVKISNETNLNREKSQDKNLKKEGNEPSQEKLHDLEIKSPDTDKNVKKIINESKKDESSEENKKDKTPTTNKKYEDVINSLNNSSKEIQPEKFSIKKENTKTKKITELYPNLCDSKEENFLEDISIDKIKNSINSNNLVEFLNQVQTNPTVLNKKDKIIYEFTTKNESEIEIIKNRYSLNDKNFEKATSMLTFSKENLKLIELSDALVSSENRIYFESKF